ncbi:MAG: nucleotidyltransferase domain-containing protein [Chloroflexi bacterium]|nr:nucleotidyltransferase domain-containing protein [Chloroflexota bacterium]
MNSRTLDRQTLDDIVQRIVAAAQPEKIILFGSAARGEMGPNSDVDLLVVKDTDDARGLAVRIYRHLRGVRVAVDAVVVKPANVERYKDSHALVIKPALREGTVVYDAA